VAKHEFLYSANSLLAYRFNERFYAGEHWVWCASSFDYQNVPLLDLSNPASSIPSKIVDGLRDAVSSDDMNHAFVNQNIAGAIDLPTFNLLVEVINQAKATDFIPLLYVMSYDKVKHLIDPSVTAGASLSDEYLIPRLTRDLFDVATMMELRRKT
jgi:hypothetical protein